MEEMFLTNLMRGDYSRGGKNMPEEHSAFSYKTLLPAILQVSRTLDYCTLTDEFNFQSRQVTHVCRFRDGVSMTTQNFRDIERKELIEEMRLKLIELKGDPDQFSGDGRKKQLLP